MQGAGGGTYGTSFLYRDGALIDASSYAGWLDVAVSPEPATYTLETQAIRRNPFTVLGTRAEAAWTFRSERVDGLRPLPLMVVRASGPIDDYGVAAAGAPYPLALRVERPPGALSAAVTELTLDVSYDDGATWTPVDVVRQGDSASATLQHPTGDGFVSLRASARDVDGNAVRHTVVRAYRIHGTDAMPDAGVPAPDAGEAPDAGGATGDGDGDGCGCRTSGGGPGAILGILLIAIAARRRRWCQAGGLGERHRRQIVSLAAVLRLVPVRQRVAADGADHVTRISLAFSWAACYRGGAGRPRSP